MAALPSPADFRRRVHTLLGFLVALARLLWNSPTILAIHFTRRRLRPPWRETLWLAVSEVNGCRFCTYVHEGMAGSAGLSPDDIVLLLTSTADPDPHAKQILQEHERLAVAYAKIWAETRGAPPVGLQDQLRAAVSEREMTDLHALLAIIDFANRAGNTLDSLLHRLGHPRLLLQPWGLLNDLLVGLLVALFGWPALLAGALQRRRNRRRQARQASQAAS